MFTCVVVAKLSAGVRPRRQRIAFRAPRRKARRESSAPKTLFLSYAIRKSARDSRSRQTVTTAAQQTFHSRWASDHDGVILTTTSKYTIRANLHREVIAGLNCSENSLDVIDSIKRRLEASLWLISVDGCVRQNHYEIEIVHELIERNRKRCWIVPHKRNRNQASVRRSEAVGMILSRDYDSILRKIRKHKREIRARRGAVRKVENVLQRNFSVSVKERRE